MHDPTILILTNSTDATTDYLCQRLDQKAVAYCRFDTDTALDSIELNLSSDYSRLSWLKHSIESRHVDSIVYRRPKPFSPAISGDNAQQVHAADEWAEALEGFLSQVPAPRWINYPPYNFIASHKTDQLVRARANGLLVPEWIVTTNPTVARNFLAKYGPDIIAKPLASGYIERDNPADDTLIYTQCINPSHDYLLDRITNCPVLFQARVPKSTDVRLIALDRHLLAVSLTARDCDGLQRLDIRRDNMRDVNYATLSVPTQIANGVLQLMNSYSLRFAAIDFAIDDKGQWNFFEINPNGQWAWLDLVGASDIGSLFVETLQKPFET